MKNTEISYNILHVCGHYNRIACPANTIPDRELWINLKIASHYPCDDRIAKDLREWRSPPCRPLSSETLPLYQYPP